MTQFNVKIAKNGSTATTTTHTAQNGHVHRTLVANFVIRISPLPTYNSATAANSHTTISGTIGTFLSVLNAQNPLQGSTVAVLQRARLPRRSHSRWCDYYKNKSKCSNTKTTNYN